jgi:formylmethanofuran dehydrogenase subunit C
MALWKPSDAPGIYSWLKATSSADYTLSGGTITAIADKSGKSHGAAQGSRSGLGFSSTGLDGSHPAFTFNGSQSIDLAVPANLNKVAYCFIGNFASGYMSIFGAEDIADLYSIGINGSNQVFIDLFNDTNVAQAGSVTRSTPQVIVVTRDATLGVHEIRVNGTVVLSGSYSHGLYSGASNHIFGGVYNRDYTTGAIGDAFVLTDYNNAILEAAEAYLAWDTGHQALLPSGHTFATAAPLAPYDSDPDLWTPDRGAADFTASGAVLQAAWRADHPEDFVLEPGSTYVAQWKDYSGNGRHLAEFNYYGNYYQGQYSPLGWDGARPAFVPGASGGNTGLQINSGLALTGPVSAFIMAKASNLDGGRLVSMKATGDQDYSTASGILIMYDAGSAKTGTLGQANGITTTVGNPYLFEVVQTASSNETFVDGVSQGVTGMTPSAGPYDCLGIGVAASESQNDSGGWKQPIAAGLLVTGTITDALRRKIEGFIAWSTGRQSALDSGHAYKTAPPTLATGPTPITGYASQNLAPVTQVTTGGPLVQGAAAQSLPAITQTATGTTSVTGAAAQSLPAVTQVATGTVVPINSAVNGSAAQSLAQVTQAAVGDVDVSGAAAQALAAQTQAAAGGVRVTGVAAQTLAPVTQAATGTTPVNGSAAQTLPAVTQVAAGDTDVRGSAAQTLPAQTQAASGNVPVNGSAGQTLGQVTQVVTGVVLVSGSANQTLAPVTQDAIGTAPLSGRTITGNQTLAQVTQVATGDVDASGAAAQALPGVTHATSGHVLISGAAYADMAAQTQVARGGVVVTGSAAQTLPAVTQVAYGSDRKKNTGAFVFMGI